MSARLNDLTGPEIVNEVSRRLAASSAAAMDHYIRVNVFGVDEATWAEWAENAKRREARDRKWPRRWLIRARYRRDFIRARISGAIDVLLHGGEYIP